MSLIPEISNLYLASFVTGLFNGTVVCTSTCLPYLASYIASTGANFRRGLIAALTFNSGRVVGYTLFGVLISVFSGLLLFFADESALSMYQAYAAIAFGIVAITIGAILLYKNKKPSCNCTQLPLYPKQRLIHRFDLGAFVLGLSRGLIFCPLLILILTASISLVNPLSSIVVAALFGLGTAISPMLLIGGVTGWLLNKATLLRTYISLAGALIIILLGIYTLVNSILGLA